MSDHFIAPSVGHLQPQRADMRVNLVAIAITSISWTANPAAAFLPHASRSSRGKAANLSARHADSFKSASSDASEKVPLPRAPRDETWSPFGVLRERLATPDVPKNAERYDRVGGLSGGIWRSIVIGLFPATVSKKICLLLILT